MLIDVLVVYSVWSVWQVNMLNLINLCIYQTKLALSMSGTNARLCLVGAFMDTLCSNSRKSNAQILNELTGTGEGQLDYAHGLRDTHGADLAHYIGENIPMGRGNFSANSGEEFGFAITCQDRAASLGDYTFAHEIGHNMVCVWYKVCDFSHFFSLLLSN